MGKRKSSISTDISYEEQLSYFFTHLLATLNPAINKVDTFEIMYTFFQTVDALDEAKARELGFEILMTGARKENGNGH